MSKGYGKRTDLIEYRAQNRGGSGIKTAKVSGKTGEIVTGRVVRADTEKDLLIISHKGQVIRLPLSSVSELGRSTQGVRLMRFKASADTVASVTTV